MNDLQRFESYLIDRYGVVAISSAIHSRLNSAIRNGVQISVLHELFKLNEKELDTIKSNNAKQGKHIDGSRLIGYDLTIILEKYPAYVRRKEAIARQAEELSSLKELQVMVENVQKFPRKANELRDVSSLVDEIFFSE